MRKKSFIIIVTTMLLAIFGGMTMQYNLQNTPKKSIIVVGAGISGLAAAHELYTQGHHVTVLEAKNTIGGRIQSTSVGGQKYQLGASFIHGKNNNPVAVILEQEGVDMSKVNFDDIIVYKNGRKTEVSDDVQPFFSFVNKRKEQLDQDQSLQATWQDYSQLHNLHDNDLLFRLRVDSQTEIGTDLSNISTLQYDEEGGLSGGDYLVTGSYDKVIDRLSRDIDIKLNHIVTKIQDNRKNVTVTTANGKQFTVDEAIVTVPLGVLQKKSITFIPSLPKDKKDAINGLKMGNLHKTFLTFDAVFWDNVTTIGIMRSDGTKWGEFINIARITKQPTLLALHGGKDAISLENVDDQLIGEQAYQALASVYPSATEPSVVVTSRWYADPFTLGSYSYVPPGASLSMYDTIAEPYGHIHFAGEHTNSKYPSTTHGAYLSGLRAASEISS